LLERTSVGQRANRDALATWFALADLARTINSKMIRHYKAGDDGLTEPPTRFDHPLISSGDWIFCKHDSGRGGVEERLHDDPDARSSKEADTLTVRDRRV
jgi:hypothetical protein